MESKLYVTDDYDKEFIHLLIEIEKNSSILDKHQLLVLDKWCKKLCEITTNIEWKKNRNLHAIYLLDMILNNNIYIPYNKFPKFDVLPMISKSYIKSKLSDKIKEIDFLKHNIFFEKRISKDNKISFFIINTCEDKEQLLDHCVNNITTNNKFNIINNKYPYNLQGNIINTSRNKTNDNNSNHSKLKKYVKLIYNNKLDDYPRSVLSKFNSRQISPNKLERTKIYNKANSNYNTKLNSIAINHNSSMFIDFNKKLYKEKPIICSKLSRPISENKTKNIKEISNCIDNKALTSSNSVIADESKYDNTKHTLINNTNNTLNNLKNKLLKLEDLNTLKEKEINENYKLIEELEEKLYETKKSINLKLVSNNKKCKTNKNNKWNFNKI